MKVGKFINIGNYSNVRIGYGTVNHVDLKSVYITLVSWIEPSNSDVDFPTITYNDVVFLAKRKIKNRINNTTTPFFKRESIVDVDIRTNGVKENKRSFMCVEITLYTNGYFDLKSSEVKNFIETLCKNIIDSDLSNKMLFNFHKTKN